VCTLRRRPDLGALIKEVKLRGCRKPGHVDATPKPDPSQVEDAMALIQPTNLPSQDVFAQELSGGNMDAWGAVLLSQLSSIRVIHVERHFATFSLMGLVLRTSILGNPDRHGLPSFSYLEDVSWDTMFHWKLNSRDEPPTGDALLLFFLPAIRQLSLTITSPAQFSWPTHHQPTPSMLTRLHLEYIREGLLGNIIAVTSNLQSLRWLWYYREDLRWRSEYVRDVIDLDQIAKDLSHVKNTLSELVITAA
jgi:hypothetical protein